MNPPVKHWSNDDVLEHLYGLKAADGHFNSCADCAARVQEAAALRARVTTPPDISHEFLAAQRRRIHERLEFPLRTWHPWRWAVPFVAMLAVALSLTLWRSPARSHSEDDRFFAEIEAVAQNPTPRAVQPLEALVGDDAPE